MLSRKLRSAVGASTNTVQYVGGRALAYGGTSSNISVPLTGLTGGIATAPAANDLVVICFGFGVASNESDHTYNISGYTQFGNVFSPSTIDGVLYAGYKFMSGIPDTSATLTSGTFDADCAGVVYVSVWRNVDKDIPFDVAPQTGVATTVIPNLRPITPVSPGSAIVVVGAGTRNSNNTSTAYQAASWLTDFKTIGAPDIDSALIGGGYVMWSGGTFTPNSFTTNSGTSTSDAACSITFALRPDNKTTDTSPIQFVGGFIQGFVGTTASTDITLTSLTGGLASSPSAGDLVLVWFATGSYTGQGNRDMVVTGYTELADLYIVRTSATVTELYASNLYVGYKFMGETPDTFITLPNGTFSSADGGCVYISVWRGVDPFLIPRILTFTDTDFRPTPPAITPIRPLSILVCGGAGASNSGRSFTSSNLPNFITATGTDTRTCNLGVGYKTSENIEFIPTQFNSIGAGTGLQASTAASLELIPTRTTFPTFVGSNGVTNGASLSVPAHQAGDWLIVVSYRTGTTSAPSTLNGYTSILTFSNSGLNANTIGARVQYVISDGTISSIPTTNGSVAVIRNVAQVGNFTFQNTSANAVTSITTVNLSAVAGSLCLFGSFDGTTVNGATGLTVAPNFGGYETVQSGETTAGGVINYSGTVPIFPCNFGVEFR